MVDSPIDGKQSIRLTTAPHVLIGQFCLLQSLVPSMTNAGEGAATTSHLPHSPACETQTKRDLDRLPSVTSGSIIQLLSQRTFYKSQPAPPQTL